MMAADTAVSADVRDAPEAEPIYRESLVKLIRAHDTYGVWEKKSDEEILQGFVLTKEQRRLIPVIGNPDPKVVWRLEIFYTAVSYAITRRTGLDATPVVKLSEEGFGRVVITVGRLVVLSRALRDVHRFGFESQDSLTAAGEALIAEGVGAIGRFPATAAETP